MQCIRRDRFAMRSTGWCYAVDSSAPRAATIWRTTADRTASACSQPIRSRHSKALFVNQASVPFGACSPWAPLSLGNESSIGQTARFGI